MASLNDIKQPIKHELDSFEGKFKGSLKSSVSLLDKVTQYILKTKGKQIRPMFVFFSAKYAGNITESSYRASALIELLHTATLVHDDVVDNADERRNFFSINALWKNKIAVLVGDYLLSRGLILALENDEFELLRIVTKAVKEMSEGELLQMEKARTLNITEDIYYDVIRQKTASLIASCCAAGASSSGADKDTIEKMWLFGEQVGMAFQIKDDLFEYEKNNSGKTKGLDFKDQKMTLPLIYTLNQSTLGEKRQIKNIIKNYNTDNEKIEWLIKSVHEKGGVVYARQVMIDYINKAKETLKSVNNPCDSMDSLIQLVDFVISRDK